MSDMTPTVYLAVLLLIIAIVHAEVPLDDFVVPLAVEKFHALMGLNCVYLIGPMTRDAALSECALNGAHLVHLYSRMQVFELISKGVINSTTAYWVGIMPINYGSPFELANLALVEVDDPAVNTTEDAGTHTLDKFEPHIGFITGSPVPATIEMNEAITWKYYFATAPPSTPQVYSAHLELALRVTELPALCQKDDFGGKRYKLVATDEGISDTLNIRLTITGAPGTGTTQSEHECAWWCLQDSHCHAFTWNTVNQACKHYVIPIQYMPYNFLIDEVGTRAYDTMIMA